MPKSTRRLPDFEAWAIFAKVGELGSFAAAARELRLTNPTVSKAVTRLEARLGVALIARTSRRLSLTQAGRAALERARRMVSEGEALEFDATEQSERLQGLIRISAPLSFGTAFLGHVLPTFLDAHPEVTLDFALSDRKVDLVAEGFDLALRISALEDSSLLSRRLCAVRLLLVASPVYLERRGRPDSPSDLSAHAALGYTGGASPGVWRFGHSELGEMAVEPTVRVWSDNADLLNPLLIAGEGLALQPEFLVWRELRDRRLEIVMPDWTLPPLSLHLLMPPGKLRPLRVQALIDHFVAELSHPPWAKSGGAQVRVGRRREGGRAAKSAPAAMVD